MTGYQRYRASRLLVWPAALSYALIALAARPSGEIELFPFFNWSLFTSAGQYRGDATLLIRSIDGHQLSSPRLFYDMKDTFAAARAKDSRLMKLIDLWSNKIRAGDEDAASAIRATVEKTFMADVGAVDYDLVIVTYDPIRRLHDGTIDSINSIGHFEKAAP
jgi:hypothetical protein